MLLSDGLDARAPESDARAEDRAAPEREPRGELDRAEPPRERLAARLARGPGRVHRVKNGDNVGIHAGNATRALGGDVVEDILEG